MSAPELVAAAGALPWRTRDGRLQVALIHRPTYDDWSWPKGKLDPGEEWQVAAVREVWEETGLRVRLGVPLPDSEYKVAGASHRKRVRYWAAEITGGSGKLQHEVDAVAWLTPEAARKRLSYDRDREQLDALVKAHRNKALDVRPFAVVRHGKALPRRKWDKDDWLRPLEPRGYREAFGLVDVLGAYGIARLLSSSATRCAETLRPYAKAAKLPLDTTYALSEEGFEKRPKKAVAAMRKHMNGARPGAICSHGPVLPDLLSALAGDARKPGRAVLKDAAKNNLEKGEVLIAQLDRRGHIVAVERIPPD